MAGPSWRPWMPTVCIWFGYSNSRVARVEGRDVRVFEASHGLAVGNVLSILAQEGEVWIGGELGFARLEGKRAVMMQSDSGTPFRGVSGIVRTRNGDIWLNGINGIVRIDADEIEALVRDPAHRLKCEIFNYLDGVPGTAVQLRPQPSAIETTDGRIWFSMTAGLVSIDAQSAGSQQPAAAGYDLVSHGQFEASSQRGRDHQSANQHHGPADRIQRWQSDRAGTRALSIQARGPG